MTILDDLAMGLGFKEKDDAYRERTAQNLERQGNQRGADQVRAQMTNNNGGGGNTSASPSTSTNLTSNVADAYRQAANTMGQAGIRNVGGSPSLGYNDTNSSGNKPVVGQGYDPVTRTGYTDTAGQDLVTEGPNYLQRTVRDSFLGRGIAALGGVDRANDKIVNTVNGKPIYQRADGTYYSINALGLPYDVAGIDTLKEDPAQVANREAMMFRTGLEENQPEEEMVAPVVDMEDPCPEGYIFDSEQKMCVIDPDIATVTPDPIATNPYTPPPLSEYTQVTNNFIPTPLTPTAPNPIEQQLKQMQQQISGPRGQQRQPRSGLAGTTLNTGIMQARP